MMGANAKGATDALIDSLKDEEPQVRTATVQALQSLGGNSQVVLEAVGKLVEDKDLSVRQTVVQSLYRFGVKSTPYWVKALEDSNDNIRQQALWGLQNYARNSNEDVLPKIVKLLDDKNAGIRNTAASSLYLYGDKAVPFMLEALK